MDTLTRALMETNNKKGRPPKFKTAEEFGKAIDDYFKWCDDNPVKVNVQTKKGVSTQTTPRPYTIYEMSWKLGIGNWRQFKITNIDREGFAALFEYAENRITSNQVIGGMVGIYNANLTARLNGIAENVQEVTPPPSTIEIVIDE